jgi:hypothetical protein
VRRLWWERLAPRDPVTRLHSNSAAGDSRLPWPASEEGEEEEEEEERLYLHLETRGGESLIERS